MKLRRTLLSMLAAATALATFSVAAPAQTYKAEYRMSLVLGPPTPWGQAGKLWAAMMVGGSWVLRRTSAKAARGGASPCRDRLTSVS